MVLNSFVLLFPDITFLERNDTFLLIKAFVSIRLCNQLLTREKLYKVFVTLDELFSLSLHFLLTSSYRIIIIKLLIIYLKKLFKHKKLQSY